jgi:TRAP-type C4-dicarboxylate transport system substrate-binding protein
MSAAVAEYVLLNCPDCVAEYAAQNQLFLSGGASTEYSMVCKEPITSLDDFKGLSIRSGAGVFGRWTEHLGGTKVSIPGSEMYEALAQGVVDCTLSGYADVTSFQLMDVAKNVVFNVPGGVFAGTASMNVNLDLWRGMSPQERKAMLEAGSLMGAATAVIYTNQGAISEAQIREAGASIIPAPADIEAATNDFIAGDLAVIEQQFTELYGVENAADKIRLMTGLIDKWKGLVDTIDVTSVEAFRGLLVSEIYSKIDPEVYGMQ